jgi:diguanylate cyclase (GGDEF)-like protein/PAS domain S-box-containing protein
MAGKTRQFRGSAQVGASETCQVVNLTLKTKATVLATGLVVAWLAAVGVLEHRQLGQDFLSVVREQQDAFAESAADDLADKLETHLAVLEHSGTVVTARTLADASLQREFLSRVSAARPLFDGIGIVSLDGDVVSSEPPSPRGAKVSIRDRDYFQKLLATGRPTMSKPLLARTGQGAAILMLAPVRDGEGRLIAAVAAGLHLQRANMLGKLSQAPVGRSGHFEVVTTGGAPVYVVHPDADKLLSPAAPVAADGPDVVTRKPIRGVDWELRVVLPASEANAPVQQAMQRRLWQLMAIGVAAALCVWLGMHWLLRPLSALHGTIRELRQSPEAELRLDTSGQDERGDLARDFEALMRDLRSRQAELEAIMGASPLGIFRAGRDGEATYVNDAYLNQFGVERSDSRKGWLQRLKADVRDEIWQGWCAAVRETTPVKQELRITRPDGSKAALAVRSAPLVIDGRVEGHVGTIEDITERIAAEKNTRLLATIFDTTSDYVVQTDARGNITYKNPAARRLVGLSADEPLRQRHFTEFNPPHTVELLARVIIPAANAAGVWVGETTIYDADRREVPVSHMVVAHRNRKGQIEHYSAVMRDMSAAVEAKQALQRQSATLRSVAEAIPAFVAVVGTDLRYRFVNLAFERWFGVQRASIVGRTMLDVLGAAEFERSRHWAERVLAGETVNFEKHYPQRQAASHLAISYVPLRLNNGALDGFVSIGQDITQHKQEAVRLLQLSQRDTLTGLLNRAGFEDFLERALNEGMGSSLALLYIDLDHFKAVNDQHGHAVGDHLLKGFAQRLRTLVRPTDCVVRLGGDEFAVVLTGVRQRSNAQVVADKVIASASLPFELGALQIRIGASVGVAFGVDPAIGWHDLLTRADTMLYQAKQGGRGRQAGALH